VGKRKGKGKGESIELLGISGLAASWLARFWKREIEGGGGEAIKSGEEKS
jgi:hypothetical protein